MNEIATVRAQLFGDVLACRDVRPAAFEPRVPDDSRYH